MQKTCYPFCVKVIILAGGRGTRLAEETSVTPKPMVTVASKPLLWHIMNIFSLQGFQDFIIATGYLSQVIDTWVKTIEEPWNVVTQYTGMETQTGGRLRQCIQASSDHSFLATYGDGLANVDIRKLVEFHKNGGLRATLTAVRPPARFGVIESKNGIVTHFGEKNQADSGWINGGFFVLDRTVADYVLSDLEPFETGALPRLVQEESLGCYHHMGFWKPMDTLRERQELEVLASRENLPWLQLSD